MTGPLLIEMATGTAVLWRCLHGGPLAAGSPDGGEGDAPVPWGEFRERNLAFLRNLTLTYGACAVVAKSDGSIIGHLRFYPKVVREMNANGLGLCLQQGFPSGPADDLGGRTFPPLKEIDDRTLLVHCIVGTEREPALEEENDFARALRTEAIEQGLDPARISNKYIMRRTLG